MLYEFAIDPDLLVSWDKCRAVLNLMGFGHGRAISAYPTRKRWKRLVKEACERHPEIKDKEFARIMEKVRASDAKLVNPRVARKYDHELEPEWIRNAVEEQTQGATFHAILASQNPCGHSDVVLDEDVDDTHPKVKVARWAMVLREPAPLLAHIEALINNSTELLLIDPHFNPVDHRWRGIVKGCLQLAAKQRFRQSEKIEPPYKEVQIHTLHQGDKSWSFQAFESACRQHLSNMTSVDDQISPLTVRISRWELRGAPHPDFHERLILTDRGGYHPDKGLDCQEGIEQKVTLLADSEWEEDYEKFRSAQDSFNLEGCFVLNTTNRNRGTE